jgi:putative peptidoglycan lipid II flippase
VFLIKNGIVLIAAVLLSINMSKLFKASLLLTIFFGINKVVALGKQIIIARQFGLSYEIDAFNAANNIPDLIFSLFSGGALALSFIPVFSEYIQEVGRFKSWNLFSKTANWLFLITAFFCVLVFIFAHPLVTNEFGIAPGLSSDQQDLVVSLMRINLIGILIFSISGLFMASLHAHKHFLLPALAPIVYNVSVIVGALVLAPESGANFGIYGLVWGTILGALLHLLVQIPAIIKHEFHWAPLFRIRDESFQKVVRLMGPRIITILFIQITFLARDNLASRLPEGSITALSYGYFIMQVPETLIGTAIATALLPTLAEVISQKNFQEFSRILQSAFRVIIATTIFISTFLWLTLPVFVNSLFHFSTSQTALVVSATQGFLLGLLGHSLLEVVVRALYARQNAKAPLAATIFRTIIFLLLAIVLFGQYGAAGIAFADSISVSIEVLLLFVVLYQSAPTSLQLTGTWIRVISGSLISGILIILILQASFFSPLISAILAISIVSVVYLLFVRQEVKLFLRL